MAAQPPQPPAEPAHRLEPGQPVTARLAAGQVHLYLIPLKAGEYLRLVVDQQGIDIAATVFDPQGRQVSVLDSSERGREPVSVVGAVAGDYRIELRPVDQAAAGQYQVKIEELRPTAPGDRERLEAERLSSEAKRLRRDGKTESLKQARERSLQALKLWKTLGDHSGEMAALVSLGDVHHALSEYVTARDYYTRALPLSRSLADPRSEGEILNNLGMGYWRTGDTEQALDSLLEAMRLFEANRFDYERAAALSNLGILYWQVGEWQNAIHHYLEALAAIRLLGDRRGEAFTLHNIGVAYSSLGEEKRALSYVEQAAGAFRAMGQGAAEARSLSVAARIYLGLGDARRAREALDRALPLARAAGDARTEGELLNYDGRAREAADVPAALQSYRQALQKFQAAGDRRNEARALDNLGLLTARQDHQAGLALLEQALELRRAVGMRDEQALSLYHLARFERDRGDLQAARARIEETLALVESLRTNVAGPSMRASYLASRLDYYKFDVDLLMRMDQRRPGEGFAVEAFAAAERARARSLLESLGEMGGEIRRGVDPVLLQKEERLRRQANFRSAQLTRLVGGKHTPEQQAAATKQLEALLTEYEQAQSEIRAASPRYAALTEPKPLTLKEVQESVLDQGTTLLEYSLGEPHSYLWAVTPTGFEGFRLASRTEIEAAARPVVELAGGAGFQRAGAVLSRLLLGPVAPQLGSRRLVIVAEGLLQRFAFAALPDPGQPGAPLLAHHEIVSLPSASTIAVLRTELAGRTPAPKTVAVLADPVFDAEDSRVKPDAKARVDPQVSYPRLPFTRREAQQIVALAPPGDSLLALDFAASKETVTGPELARYRIVHLATHGVLNDQQPELSALVFSLVDPHGGPRDGLLRLNEIYNLNLPAELVVLSACRTGLGTDVQGEGLVGLGRGFMYAGARRLVVSLWNVDDESTAELMKRFYQGMLGPHPLAPSAALRAAQLSIRREKRWAAPRYWAGLAFQGEWR